ncbi:MAG: endonuclease III [Muribaculaceae bacterium]
MRKAELYRLVVERFQQHMPVAETELHYRNPFELLVAVILSAQCTDKRVNLVTPALFEAFPTPQALAQATDEQVFALIRSVSYPNNKTRSLLGMARRLVDEFGGEVPSNLDDLVTLPGVGRKTANVILSVVYDQPAMAVDTHVFRVAERIGLTRNSRSPLQTERTLTDNIPTEHIARAHHWLILHGRYVCRARKPDCPNCFLSDLCRYNQSASCKKPS